uniref:Uncharacterized protein n=1 Tax=Rhizophora mucronata TaxID=61149 RepID=A0A2P2LE56_RHIMU
MMNLRKTKRKMETGRTGGKTMTTEKKQTMKRNLKSLVCCVCSVAPSTVPATNCSNTVVCFTSSIFRD